MYNVVKVKSRGAFNLEFRKKTSQSGCWTQNTPGPGPKVGGFRDDDFNRKMGSEGVRGGPGGHGTEK